MIYLPIAARELRIAARSARTFAARWGTASVAFIVFFWTYWLFGTFGGAGGIRIFQVLSILSYIYALSAGVLLTADCISSEKREGTFGLLFLTSLQPYDIVAGNIVATSLKAFYGLLAAFPILGLSMILGSVGAGEFGRICLTLISAMAFSLAFSLLISCLSEKHLTAASGAVLGLLFFAVILPVVCAGLRKVLEVLGYSTDWILVAELFSPTTALDYASAAWFAQQKYFWLSLLAVNLMSAGIFVLACWSTRKRNGGAREPGICERESLPRGAKS